MSAQTAQAVIIAGGAIGITLGMAIIALIISTAPQSLADEDRSH